ncbi:2-oxoglutarate dehydrogenase E1 component [Engelhardtia mirabilis]|uniref:2-oxoglutarate dehydrogenase E1 component n=1 Tax=Engelhardtia mirabilis TaxID=2528011 RepID=A0A518BJF1_9BACT|nr:2-oxoglutarate dehydrogenase E1 component [Planctomycetes bacterium Pla133]QDV01438.1 2-oxoglutarate dehydrogenase E1 component [Planctomycetes bacterium Pla86]
MSEEAPLPNAASLGFAEDLYAQFLADPVSVDPDWRSYFERLRRDDAFAATPQLGPARHQSGLFRAALPAAGAPSGNGRALGTHALDGSVTDEGLVKQDRVDQLIRAYRVRGHLIAQLDPLGLPRAPQRELETSFYGLSDADLDRRFSTATIYGLESGTLRQAIERLHDTYCRSIGVQFMHIDDLNVKNWLTERMESTTNRVTLTRDEQLRILTCLTDSVIFEEFLQKKFLGAKRFSLEGGESLIPLLDMAIEEAARHGVQEVVFGMAHRGRINVLANIMGKPTADIFAEFSDKNPEDQMGRGDVKYHLGYSSDRATQAGHDVHLTLCFNPSHLEFVNPVALGRMRAKQDRHGDTERREGMCVLIHGDAAFIGQGVVQESLNLSQLEGYATGGTVHVVVNNQVGFTTSPADSRSCTYATDIAKFLQVPIFHVNGEDPEAVAQVVKLGLEFRRTFKRDVVIDMYCYRRYGHNEGDEPEFTQPLMYKAIKQRKSVREGYLERLTSLGGISQSDADELEAKRREVLEQQLSEARKDDFKKNTSSLGGFWTNYRGGLDHEVPRIVTDCDAGRFGALLERLCEVPEGFTPHAKIKRLLAQRLEMAHGERPLDWAAAEAVALASLLTEGNAIRLTGQDSQRGTFSQRHAVLHDYETGETYMPLAHLTEKQGSIEIHNSSLSEVGVMGFEYGYSLDRPDVLVMWEAQFGDFVNGAQVIIDQFLVSAETKWRRLSGLVLLLPHGFEGQGPEHSSARLERFLALAAEDNIQIVNPTTPAQYLNVLRRQVLRPWRKPLIVMTPKSLLRSPSATSTLEECAAGHFHRVLPDAGEVNGKRIDPAKVERILLCSGKVYYDLIERREQDERTDVALLRLEQLYPLTEDDLRHALDPYAEGLPIHWVQEEPENMGAWPYLQTQAQFNQNVLRKHPFMGVYRPASAVPATGSPAAHKLEQAALVDRAFGTA